MTSLIGLPIVGMQRGCYRAKRRRVDTVARSLELNAFETARHLVHLEEHNHWHPAKRLPGEDDVGVAVAKVEGSRQPPCFVSEQIEQPARQFAPMGFVQ